MKPIVFLSSTLVVGVCTLAVITSLPNPALEAVAGIPARSAAIPIAVFEEDASDASAVVDAPDRNRSGVEMEVVAIRKPEETAAKMEELREALAAAAQIENAQLRNEALASICYRWAECDPRQALEIALDYRLQEAPGAVIENLAQQWAMVDFSAAREWIDSQQPCDLRSDLVARLGYLWAGSDPEAAAVFVLSRTKPGPIQAEAVLSVLHQWTQRDRIAAREWVGKFPPGELRERALWETQDHSAAIPQ